MFWKNIKNFLDVHFSINSQYFLHLLELFFHHFSLVSKLKANDGYYLKKLSDKLSYNFNYDLLNYFPNWHYGEDIGMGVEFTIYAGVYTHLYALLC